jgi:hypothetical protein
MAEFLEIGPPVSLLADIRAATVKAARPGLLGTENRWASGLARALRSVLPSSARAVTNVIADYVTPPTAVAGVATATFNTTIWVQCAAGILK